MAVTPQSFTKVHGGIRDDQNLKGNLRFFDISQAGLFANTISDGNVIIPGLPKFGGTNTVGIGRPVPRSAAELALQVVTMRGMISKVSLISDNTIQIILENDSADWTATDLQTEIRALGVQIVPDNTSDGVSVNLNAVVVFEFATFKLV